MALNNESVVTKRRLQYFKNKIQVLLNNKISTVTINGEDTAVDLENGNADLTIPNVTADPFDVKITMGGNDYTKGVEIKATKENTKDVVDLIYYHDNFESHRPESVRLASTEYVSDQITQNISSLTGISFQIVADTDSLPIEGTSGVFYLVPNTGSGRNVYDEYVWVNKGSAETPNYSYEMLGSTAVDLSGYVQDSELTEITEADIDAMFA